MRCIFCLGPSDNAKSVEHIIPESLGNTRHVLPRGVVCDGCNNYFSRKLEGPVLSHRSFRNLRAWIGLRTKRGRPPAFCATQLSSGATVSLRIANDGDIHVTPEKGRDLDRILAHGSIDEATGLHGFGINFDLDPPKKEMSRLLAKMALERAYADFSKARPAAPHLIFDSYLDNIRNWARRGDNFDEWPFHQRTIYPQETRMRHPQTNAWVKAGIGQGLFHTDAPETHFSICLYGVEFVINLGRPSIDGFEDWLRQHNFQSPFLAHQGFRLAANEGENGVMYFLDKCRPIKTRFHQQA